MSDVNGAPDTGAPAPVSTPPTPSAAPAEIRGSTPRELARGLAERWRKQDEQAPSPDTGAPSRGNSRDEAAAQPPPAPAAPADAAPPQEAPGDTPTEDTETDAESPIPRPRSWKAEYDAQWQSFPREAQAIIAQREAERDRVTRQYQNENAEKLKGLTAKEQLVEQARQYYEQALPALQQSLQNGIAGEFSDIRSMDDAIRLAEIDPARYSKWDAAQKRLQIINEQHKTAQETAQKQQQEAWDKWSAEQDRAFAEKVPELSDPVKGPKLRDDTFSTLKNVGFQQDELVESWNRGQLRDYRVQLLVYKAAKFDQAEAAAKKASAKPVPQVQKPGVSRPRGAGDSEAIDALRQQFHKKQDVRSGAALLAARWRSKS